MPERAASYDRPIGLGTVIEVDTTRPIDVDALAARLASLLDRA